MPQRQLEPYMWELDKLFENKIYNIPVYQRPYSWGREHVETLLDDIFEAYLSPERSEGYYTGNIILHDKNEKENGVVAVYEVIDGQQRITSFVLLLLSLYSICTKRNAPPTDYAYGALKKCIWKIVRTREPEKAYKTIRLNSIEKPCFDDIVDYAFDHPQQLMHYISNYQAQSEPAKLIIENTKIIFNRLESELPGDDCNAVLDFAQYILENVRFIAIECRSKENKVFSMFESINSKGKSLEVIDLIKTYIFSMLDERSYQEYLQKWGQLIIETNDNLYDYFYTYIRSFVCFYRQNIKMLNFKAMSRDILKAHFECETLGETYKKMIDDMLLKIKYYNMLSSVEEAYALIKSKKFRFYYKLFVGSYIHPKPLFMRLFVEFSENKIGKDDAVEIVVEVIKFMIKFSNIGERDSKDMITLFSNIMDDIYAEKAINRERVLARIANETANMGLSDDTIAHGLRNMDAYEKNKKVSTALLALYDSLYEENGRKKISYDKAYVIVDKFAEAFSLDHLLAQNPAMASSEYRYYCENTNGNAVLRLKEGHDFPSDIFDGMQYDTFKKRILNKLGNLRVYYQDKNSGRQNTAIELPEYGDFYSYQDIVNRETLLIQEIIDNILYVPRVILDGLPKKAKQVERNLASMEKLIESGMVNIGDELYLTVAPSNSTAKLIAANKVLYNGEEMTTNQWGCLITGWSAIRIYAYTARVGETETLHDKRLRLLEQPS